MNSDLVRLLWACCLLFFVFTAPAQHISKTLATHFRQLFFVFTAPATTLLGKKTQEHASSTKHASADPEKIINSDLDRLLWGF
jgi:hypothetical protein